MQLTSFTAPVQKIGPNLAHNAEYGGVFVADQSNFDQSPDVHQEDRSHRQRTEDIDRRHADNDGCGKIERCG